jgi:hypothetical protein
MIVREVDGELVVYDTSRHVAHRLNAAAARVWEHCDGRTSATEIAQRVGSTSEPVDEATVHAALGALQEAELLDDHPVPAAPVTRRTAVRRMAEVAGSALVPLVISIAAPTPADALSFGGPGHGRGNGKGGGNENGNGKGGGNGGGKPPKPPKPSKHGR